MVFFHEIVKVSFRFYALIKLLCVLVFVFRFPCYYKHDRMIEMLLLYCYYVDSVSNKHKLSLYYIVLRLRGKKMMNLR